IKRWVACGPVSTVASGQMASAAEAAVDGRLTACAAGGAAGAGSVGRAGGVDAGRANAATSLSDPAEGGCTVSAKNSSTRTLRRRALILLIITHDTYHGPIYQWA